MSDGNGLWEAVLDRLATVIDPETGVDILRMRLIEELVVDQHGIVSYTFRPSSALCPLAVPLALEIRSAVAGVPGVTGQAMRIEGYAGSDALSLLLEELADAVDQDWAPAGRRARS